ncbi:hypothetical protein BO78DRAFT_333564 [Aspergillus sclerotiicarbonarius CBS 121057]|uniref:Mitochondrial division protein 1 n=1 Tax=Aspergillus sclerotiicarbonarius (strain CBS 121057 / IBT 28362) TaxID=1448318 RepID=A0A319EPY8_ASPSB|nr:hypothetical protein BO78DRAFT_333564 [Aspergillus sclerotiicarbonarius CBS 121057]
MSVYYETLKYQIDVVKQYSRSTAGRYLRDIVVADNWKSMIENIKAKDRLVIDYLDVQSNALMRKIKHDIQQFHDQTQASIDGIGQDIKKIHQSHTLDKLEFLKKATYTARVQEDTECLEGTQIPMLQQIQLWIDDPDSPPIFWLYGMAGTGKSTIARTVASRFDDRRSLVCQGKLPSNICLGATFFFKRRKQGRSYADAFVSTLARQLVDALPDLAGPVCKAIENNLGISGDRLGIQWNDLILNPLKDLGQRILPHLTILLVIDALDECLPETPDTPDKPGQNTDNTDIQTILELLKQVQELQSSQVRIRVFLTSRPTDEIQSQFGQMPVDDHQDERLLKVPFPPADFSHKDDLTLLFEHRLKEIEADRRKHSKRWDAKWSSEETIRDLVCQSNGLFIFAATACRFLAQPRTKIIDRLDMILRSGKDAKIDKATPQGKLDALYIDILNAELIGAVTESERFERTAQFRKIVGTIIILSEPLGVHALSRLISDELEGMESEVGEMLRCLQSVMSVSQDDNSIELLHLSFRDFLVANERCGDDFWINEKELHEELFERCLEIMSQTLEKDVCHLGRVSTRIEDVRPDQLEQYLPEHARYACSSWAYHLHRSNGKLSDNGKLHTFRKQHFTHWVEAMAVTEKTPASIQMLNILLACIPTSAKQCSEFSVFVHDAKRFLINFRSVVEQAPLQVYVSALLFTPRNSTVRAHFEDEIPSWIAERPMVLEDWNPVLQTLELVPSRIRSGSFSPDQKFLATTSSDGIVSVWDTETWKCVQNLELGGHHIFNEVLSFSPDGKLMAYPGVYGYLEVWHLEKRTSKRLGCDMKDTDRKQYPKNDCERLLFSPDGRKIVSVHCRQKVQIWDLYTGELLRTIERESREWSTTLAISPDGNLLLCGWGDSLELRDASEGVLLHLVEDHVRQSSAFLPDGKLMFVSRDGTVQCWDPNTRALQSGMNIGSTQCASFSPDGKLLLAVSEHDQLLVWDLVSATLCTSLAVDPKLVRLYFHLAWLPITGSHVMVASKYGVCVWEASTGKLQKELGGQHLEIVAISSDGNLVAAHDRTSVKILEWLSGASKTVNGLVCETGEFCALSPDGTFMITTERGIMLVWHTKSKERVQTLRLQDGLYISAAVFSQDGTRVVTMTTSFSVTVWDVNSWDSLHTFVPSVPEDYVVHHWQSEISPEAGLLALSFRGNPYSIDIWDLKSGEHLRTIDSKELPLSLTISPDGRLVASVLATPYSCCIWNINTGELVKIIDCGWVLAFSPTSEFLASTSRGLVMLWCTNTWNKMGELRLDDNTITGGTFSRDGQWLCTNMGPIRVDSILDPKVGPLGKEITLNKDRGFLSEGGKELILIPPSSKPDRLVCADPSAVQYNSVALCYPDASAVTIGFDNSENRTVREILEE